MLKRINNENGFALSTLLYGMVIVGVLVVLLIVATAQFTSTSSQSFVQKVEANLNKFADDHFYGQGCPKYLYDAIRKRANTDNVSSEYVSNTSGITLSANASDTNGKGIYKISTTADDYYPIYYYRGNVNNNNVKFAGFCWKIVRTTNTGGIKLIYNGVPDANGYCTNKTGTATQIDTSYFNNKTSINSNGYMHGSQYTHATKNMNWYSLAGKTIATKTSLNSTNYYYATSVTYNAGKYTLTNPVQKNWSSNYNSLSNYYTCFSTDTSCSTVRYINSTEETSATYISLTSGQTHTTIKDNIPTWKFGKSVTYADGKFTLTSQKTLDLNNWNTNYSTILGSSGYHYTCLSTDDTCTTVKYIINYDTSTKQIKYMTLKNGNKISNAITDMTTNTYNSTIKNEIDEWYSTNLNSYTDKLEDTFWCNDRSIAIYAGFSETGTGIDKFLKYKSNKSVTTYPLACSNIRDMFSTTSAVGNGVLDYPIGLLTKAEIIYSGCIDNNQSCYLYTNEDWWTLTPDSLGTTNYGNHFYMSRDGSLTTNPTNNAYGIRPVISLKNSTIYYDGDGTQANPYVIPE